MSSGSPLFQDLNPEQKSAVEHISGPLLILAGAGSGKTRVLTHRMAHLVAEGEATPEQILAVTFTNKAAREMAHRAASLLGDLRIPLFSEMWISTFHSSCARILRNHIELLGYQPFFVIYDEAEQLSVVKKVMEDLNISDKVYPAKAFRARINEAKQLGLTPVQVGARAPELMANQDLEVYEKYERKMKASNALDFGDLLLKTHELWTNQPQILKEYQEQFRFIMVDEYQDTNHLQYLLVKQLSSGHRNLCVVGDEDQSIYSWRGADIRNILDFEKDFPETTIIKLEQNYRSTQTIVSAASALIQNNEERKKKVLFTNNPRGSKILVQENPTEYDEARFVADTIARLAAENSTTLNDFAVFYRTNAQSRVLEDVFRSRGISYRLVGGMKFYERMEIKDILGYMKLILNTKDDVSCQRIINTPPRGIGKTTVEKLSGFARDRGISLLEAIRAGAEERIVHSGACRKLREFLNLVESLTASAAGKKTSEIYLDILEKTQYALLLKNEATAEALARIDNLEEFANAIHQFEAERPDEAGLQAFLEEMALVSDVDQLDENAPGITMMTLHVSKGLEFPNVFIVGMEEGLFPSIMKVESEDPAQIEEERRLAYVGMTRARENLFLSYARTRRVWGQEQHHAPSRFIDEIPTEFLTSFSPFKKPAFLERYVQQYGQLETRGPKFSRLKQEGAFESDEVPHYEDFNDVEGSKSPAKGGFKKGMKIRHPTFGVGSIFSIEGTGDLQKIGVLFKNQSIKKFLVKYARFEILA